MPVQGEDSYAVRDTDIVEHKGHGRDNVAQEDMQDEKNTLAVPGMSIAAVGTIHYRVVGNRGQGTPVHSDHPHGLRSRHIY